MEVGINNCILLCQQQSFGCYYNSIIACVWVLRNNILYNVPLQISSTYNCFRQTLAFNWEIFWSWTTTHLLSLRNKNYIKKLKRYFNDQIRDPVVFSSGGLGHHAMEPFLQLQNVTTNYTKYRKKPILCWDISPRNIFNVLIKQL